MSTSPTSYKPNGHLHPAHPAAIHPAHPTTPSVAPTRVPSPGRGISNDRSKVSSAELIAEIQDFKAKCSRRSRLNGAGDFLLCAVGVSLALGMVVAGFWKNPAINAALGAVMATVVIAQKALPLSRRAAFYRLLLGHAENLQMQVKEDLVSRKEVLRTLAMLRMDFAQQLQAASVFRRA